MTDSVSVNMTNELDLNFKDDSSNGLSNCYSIKRNDNNTLPK